MICLAWFFLVWGIFVIFNPRLLHLGMKVGVSSIRFFSIVFLTEVNVYSMSVDVYNDKRVFVFWTPSLCWFLCTWTYHLVLYVNTTLADLVCCLNSHIVLSECELHIQSVSIVDTIFSQKHQLVFVDFSYLDSEMIMFHKNCKGSSYCIRSVNWIKKLPF